MGNQIFMQYVCRECGAMFLDKDVKGRMTPVLGFVCPTCRELGFTNPEVRPKKKLSAKQQETLKKNQFGGRKNSPKKEDYPLGVIGGCQ